MSERTHACRSYKMITSTGIHKVTRVVRTHVTRVTSGSDQLPTWAPQGLNQIYSVQVFSSAGTYTLSFGGQTTSSLPYNATPGAVQAALAALSSVGNANDVRVTQPHPESGQLLVEFLGSLGWSSFGPTGLTVTGSSLADPVAIQRVTLAGADGGTFRLSFNGSTTSALAAGATASAVQTALRALPTVNGANVSVAGSAGGPYTATFGGALTGVQPLLVGDATSLTYLGSPGGTVGVQEVARGGIKAAVVTQVQAGTPRGQAQTLGVGYRDGAVVAQRVESETPTWAKPQGAYHDVRTGTVTIPTPPASGEQGTRKYWRGHTFGTVRKVPALTWR
jgi:hypothetical protein